MKIRFNGTASPRILLRAANWVGDAVMMTPAVCALRNRFPGAELFVLAKPWVVPVFEENRHIDRILVYDKKERHRGLKGLFRLVRELRVFHFDAAVLFQNAFEAALIAVLSGIPVRIGYSTDGRGILLTHRTPLPPTFPRIHQIDYYLGILGGMPLSGTCRRLHLSIGNARMERGRRLLERYGISKTETLVGLNPGAAYGSAKQWPPDRFAALGDRIQESRDARILIFGGPEDQALGFEIRHRMKRPSINLTGKTDLSEAMALIRECAVLVTNDSGLMHVASALGVPLVAIFGSTDPETTGPRDYRGAILRSGIPCSPCLEPECPFGHLKCMDEISTDAVFKAAEAFL